MKSLQAEFGSVLLCKPLFHGKQRNGITRSLFLNAQGGTNSHIFRVCRKPLSILRLNCCEVCGAQKHMSSSDLPTGPMMTESH